MRLLLVLLLVHGMVPSLGEAAEAVVHFVETGHLAHTAADQGDLGDQGGEHGCSPTEHRCACCAAQPLVMASAGRVIPAPVAVATGASASADPWPGRALEPPFRPPIA